MSLRQLACVLVGGSVCFGTYFLLKPLFGADFASDIIIFEAIPIFAFGFIKVRSLNFEDFLRAFIKHKFNKQKRIYETDIYSNEFANLYKKEVSKGARDEVTRTTGIGRNEKNKRIKETIKRAKKEFQENTKRKKQEQREIESK